ncbi:hypothetical protein OB69_15475 [Roseivirga seohaensis subsp. aquiponti]|uniref:VLRF1 domain-containing protein n=1 Tax=Roseivirga seohaensis subsp. aquiponti TaxID=1566026 RepID=A0A0L8AHL9_9BACT|nr:hypothetical protein [Roseivirga seohaensis]KOF01747.1 hypothetical protein OB69_15475 [Roseivirga seohaensis subsp. aquiponti]
MKSIFFDRSEVPEILDKIRGLNFQTQYDFNKHRVELGLEGQDREAYLRLPLILTCNQNLVLDFEKEVNYLMLLVQSGSASVGVFKGEKCLAHKVFGAYMVRKKQGKSQIKHLKTKGKSRAGSRVRLASTLEFFENINLRLQDHFKEYEFDRIALSCSKILIPYLFGSKESTPFDKKDDRLYKIPKHLHQPNFEVMLGMQKYLNKAELVYDDAFFEQFDELKNKGTSY